MATPGAGIGASHQTGWTGLVAHLLVPRRDLIDAIDSGRSTARMGMQPEPGQGSRQRKD